MVGHVLADEESRHLFEIEDGKTQKGSGNRGGLRRRAIPPRPENPGFSRKPMKSKLILQTIFALAMALSAACSFSHSANAGSLPALIRATSGLSATGKSTVGILVLGQGPQSDYDAALIRSSAAQYALRHVDLVILRQSGDRYMPESFAGQCDGQDACATDAFMDGLTPSDVAQLLGKSQGNTMFVAYDGQAKVVGRSYGGFDSLHDLIRFAALLDKADPSHPATAYANSVMNDTQ